MDMRVTMRQLGYRILYFGVLGLLLASAVLVFVLGADGWWAVVPAGLAIAWVSPLTGGIVDRCLRD
jgi:hypothetical protein